jgi:uncharacterized protein (DUF1697 family)
MKRKLFSGGDDMKYVAFLRGINVGGHKLIKMEDLAKMFAAMGFSHIRTIIASGNVLFESSEKEEETLAANIEKHLFQLLTYEVKVLLRTIPQLQEMVLKNPFKNFVTEQNVKLYVAFLAAVPNTIPPLPIKSAKDGFEIVAIVNREIYIVAFQLPNGRFGNLTYIEKTFGEYTTTRNWNTVVKIALEK